MIQSFSLFRCFLILISLFVAGQAMAQPDYLAQCQAPDATDRLRIEVCAFAGHDKTLPDEDRAVALARRGDTIASQVRKLPNRFDLRDLARADFAEALRLSPENADIQRRYIDFNSHWSGETDDQLAAVNKVIAAEGEDAGLLLQRAKAAFRRSENDQALANIQRSIKLDDRNADAHRLAGLILTTLLRNNESVAAYSKAISLAPDRPELYFERMGPALAAQQFALAQEDGNAVLAQNFPNMPFWQVRGAANYLLHDYQAAAADFAHDFKIDRQAVRMLVWKFLAEQRAGSIDTKAAAAKARGLGDQWPSTVFSYFAGQGRSADVMAQANLAPIELRPTRLSQAKFYIAEWGLITDAPKDALKKQFAEVVAAGFLFGMADSSSLGEPVIINDNCILEMAAAVARLKELQP